MNIKIQYDKSEPVIKELIQYSLTVTVSAAQEHVQIITEKGVKFWSDTKHLDNTSTQP